MSESEIAKLLFLASRASTFLVRLDNSRDGYRKKSRLVV
jgi:hypothetical protein